MRRDDRQALRREMDRIWKEVQLLGLQILQTKRLQTVVRYVVAFFDEQPFVKSAFALKYRHKAR